MHPHLLEIADAAKGLLYISETDQPLEPVELKTTSIEKEIIAMTGANENTEVEKIGLDHFFRNMIRTYPRSSKEEIASAEKFQRLAELLKKSLHDVTVYRIGKIQIKAFIIGRLDDGSYAGLSTSLVET